MITSLLWLRRRRYTHRVTFGCNPRVRAWKITVKDIITNTTIMTIYETLNDKTLWTLEKHRELTTQHTESIYRKRVTSRAHKSAMRLGGVIY